MYTVLQTNFKISNFLLVIRYQVLTAEATNLAQFEVIKTLYESDEYDFWTTPRKMGATDLMASHEQVKDLEDLFLTHGIKYEVKIKDVQR